MWLENTPSCGLDQQGPHVYSEAHKHKSHGRERQSNCCEGRSIRGSAMRHVESPSHLLRRSSLVATNWTMCNLRTAIEVTNAWGRRKKESKNQRSQPTDSRRGDGLYFRFSGPSSWDRCHATGMLRVCKAGTDPLHPFTESYSAGSLDSKLYVTSNKQLQSVLRTECDLNKTMPVQVGA